MGWGSDTCRTRHRPARFPNRTGPIPSTDLQLSMGAKPGLGRSSRRSTAPVCCGFSR